MAISPGCSPVAPRAAGAGRNSHEPGIGTAEELNGRCETWRIKARRPSCICVAAGVGEVFIGDPHGVRRRKSGKKHNQRMGQWEYGRDLRYLQQKLKRAGIACSTGSERGTSSRCPRCGHRHKPKGRVWQCKACGFTGHRDLVGSVNMHEDNFEKLVKFPSLVDTTYLRPGAMVLAHAGGLKSRRRGSSSRPGTGHGEGASPPAPVLLLELNRDTACGKAGRAPDGAGHLIERSTEAHSL